MSGRSSGPCRMSPDPSRLGTPSGRRETDQDENDHGDHSLLDGGQDQNVLQELYLSHSPSDNADLSRGPRQPCFDLNPQAVANVVAENRRAQSHLCKASQGRRVERCSDMPTPLFDMGIAFVIPIRRPLRGNAAFPSPPFRLYTHRPGAIYFGNARS